MEKQETAEKPKHSLANKVARLIGAVGMAATLYLGGCIFYNYYQAIRKDTPANALAESFRVKADSLNRIIDDTTKGSPKIRAFFELRFFGYQLEKVMDEESRIRRDYLDSKRWLLPWPQRIEYPRIAEIGQMYVPQDPTDGTKAPPLF